MMDRWHGATPWLVERKDRHDGGQSKKWLKCIQQFLTPSFSFTSVCVCGVGGGVGVGAGNESCLVMFNSLQSHVL